MDIRKQGLKELLEKSAARKSLSKRNQVADEKSKDEKFAEGKTHAELLALVKEQQEQIRLMAANNRAELKEFAQELAFKISHPEPTEEEIKRRQENVRTRIERAQEEDAQKAHKRRHCVHPARPNAPHRRYGTEWGMFNNTSVIAWHYTTVSKRTSAGTSTDGDQAAFGVCQWCGTEFKPGDPDYLEALGWGLSTAVGTYPMNQRTGIWQ